MGVDAKALTQALAPVDLTSTSGSKWNAVKAVVAKGFGLEAGDIGAVGVPTREAMGARGDTRIKVVRGDAIGLLTLGFLPQGFDWDWIGGRFDKHEIVDTLIVAAPKSANGNPRPRRAWQRQGSPFSLSSLNLEQVIAKPSLAQPVSKISPAPAAADDEINLEDLAIDERIFRMIRAAVRTSTAVLLVGPPGTGKTTLLRWIQQAAKSDPEAWGLGSEPAYTEMLTPDESWTAADLVGGLSVAKAIEGGDSAPLAYEPGHLLRAIANDEWMMLDETNRADLDKIFGPLFTWLTDHEVRLGDAWSGGDAPPVVLGFSATPESTTDLDRLVAREGSEPIRFSAGTDWRLLGSYNAKDAQRVFRFGAALGRRFIQVPIPAPSVEKFRDVLDNRFPDLDSESSDLVVRCYAGQIATESPLGPAMFIDLARLVADARGLHKGSLDDALASELFAEAYVLAVGRHLVRMEQEEVEELRSLIVDELDATAPHPFDDEQWAWITETIRQYA